MKIFLIFLFLAIVSYWIFSQSGSEIIPPVRVGLKTIDTIPPVINLQGKINDTACQHSIYRDPGATVLDKKNGWLSCADDIVLQTQGEVNTTLTGSYLLTYSAVDSAGNFAATVSRTVHVVENNAAFLNGVYNVVCTCTTIADKSAGAIITTDQFIAAISTGAVNSRFELSALRVGPLNVISSPYLSGNSIYAAYYISPADFQQGGSSAIGSLSPTKDTFTIETIAHKWAPSVTYICRNVYTKVKPV